MKPENAINFLLYSYFGITLDDKEEEIICAAIDRAYRDASGRVLSVAEETKKSDLKKEAGNYLCSRLKEDLMDYPEWHNTTCNHLENVIYHKVKNNHGEKAFYYGHAQKWVNMTMKYLYVIKNIFHEYKIEILENFNDSIEKQLHVPVDNYILEAASKKEVTVNGVKRKLKYGLKIQLPQNKKNEIGNQTNKIPMGGFSQSKAWSKWEYPDYSQFRKQMEESMREKYPYLLDWECPAWIEISKVRKENAKEKKKNKF